MYLIFPNKNEADTRNITEAVKRGHDLNSTNRVWPIAHEFKNGKVALSVGKGEGLTEEELGNCVDTIKELE